MKALLFSIGPWLFVIAVVAVICAYAKRYGFPARSAPEDKTDAEPWPFVAKRPLSDPEQVLYHRLVKALPGRIILAQVQASRILGVKKGFNVNSWNNRINRLSFDFVICEFDSTVLVAIELDDRSHDSAKRMQTDQKKDKAAAAAGIRVIRWKTTKIPDEVTIQSALAEFGHQGRSA